jgi:hypothetical protein
MSTTTNIGGGNVVQSLAQKVLTTFDADGDSRLSPDEFQNFLQKLVATLSGATLPTTNAATSSATSAAPSASARAAAAGAAAAGQYEFRGFDASRAQSAAGTLKYDAYNVLQRYDPADPTTMRKAFDELSAIHPGQYELDSQDNLMLTGTADGYIGARPNDRNSDWTNRNQPWNWSWMAYNVAHPGPKGEIT